jgi:carboxylesterase type B
LGNLRFAATQPPLNNRSAGVQNGLYGNICPQAFASWQIGALSLNPGASNENEDCLFLDVVVPKRVFDNKTKRDPVPVIVWFYGGGYTLGSKYAAGNPTGLLDQSLDLQSKGQIWVGFNYRLGAMGWLGGPTFAKSGTPNAGFYDQRMALKWVQDHIELFGGDPDQVTVMGESAGGGSIMHQITAYGGVEAPFQQAILQSPAFIPRPLVSQSESAFQSLLKFANVSTLAELRKVDTLVLQQANKLTQALAFYGTFTFGMLIPIKE